MTVTIYHNPACGTSRNALALIRNSGEEPVVIEYLKTPPGRAELVSLIGLKEMTYLAKQASAATREPFTFFLFAAALFLIYTSVSLWALRWLERRFSLGVKRART